MHAASQPAPELSRDATAPHSYPTAAPLFASSTHATSRNFGNGTARSEKRTRTPRADRTAIPRTRHVTPAIATGTRPATFKRMYDFSDALAASARPIGDDMEAFCTDLQSDFLGRCLLTRDLARIRRLPASRAAPIFLRRQQKISARAGPGTRPERLPRENLPRAPSAVLTSFPEWGRSGNTPPPQRGTKPGRTCIFWPNYGSTADA